MLHRQQAGVVAAYAIMIASNALSTASTVFNGTDNARISRENPTYLSPDGATFSIWGFIYLFETFLVIYQALPRFANTPELQGRTRAWLTAAFLLNAIWLPIFSYHRWWLSLLVIVCYLGALAKTYDALAVQYSTSRSTSTTLTKIFAFTGLSLNFAWVVVATLLNFTIVSRNSGIIVTTITAGNITATTAGALPPYHQSVVGGNVDWAFAATVVAAGLGCYRAISQLDVPYAFVTSWALAGIYRMQMFASDEIFPTEGKSHDLATWALTLSLIVASVGLCGLAKAVYEGCYSAPGSQCSVAREGKDDSIGTLTRRLSSGARV